LFDGLRESRADARDLFEAAGRDNVLERLTQQQEAFGSPRVRSRLEGVLSGEDKPLPDLGESRRNGLRIQAAFIPRVG
jgi:hypothetical protein